MRLTRKQIQTIRDALYVYKAPTSTYQKTRDELYEIMEKELDESTLGDSWNLVRLVRLVRPGCRVAEGNRNER